MIFNFSSEATTNAMGAIVIDGPLIKKIYVPKYMFVLSRIFSSSINLLASFTAMIFVMLAMRVELHYTVLLAPIPLLFYCRSFHWEWNILSAITVKFRDIMHLYSVFVTALMYLTPIYLPDVDSSRLAEEIVLLNPLTNILTMFRNVMINMLPSISSILLTLIEVTV